MPTILTHPAVPLAIGLGLGKKTVSRRLLVSGVIASVLPDLDVIGFRFGVPYGAQFGHRGCTHSLLVAAAMGFVAAVFARALRTSWVTAWLFVFVSAASHGLLDTLTTGGRGVALLWPFATTRYFAPWRVIQVSPIGVQRFAQHGPLTVLRSELIWVWVPMIVVTVLMVIIRRWGGRSGPTSP